MGQSYLTMKYCSNCVRWRSNEFFNCPECNTRLRGKPRNSKTRKLYYLEN